MSSTNYPPGTLSRSSYSSRTSAVDLHLKFHYLHLASELAQAGNADVVFRSGRKIDMLAVALIAFAAICFWYAVPRHIGVTLASIGLLTGVALWIWGQITREFSFRRREQVITVRCKFFGVSLSDRSEPYDNIDVMCRTMLAVNKSSVRAQLYYAVQLEKVVYLFRLPASVEVSDARLADFKKILGFTKKPNKAQARR